MNKSRAVVSYKLASAWFWRISLIGILQWYDKKQYNETLKKLAGLFQKNFEIYEDYKVGGDSKLTERIIAAGPRLEWWSDGAAEAEWCAEGSSLCLLRWENIMEDDGNDDESRVVFKVGWAPLGNIFFTA